VLRIIVNKQSKYLAYVIIGTSLACSKSPI